MGERSSTGAQAGALLNSWTPALQSFHTAGNRDGEETCPWRRGSGNSQLSIPLEGRQILFEGPLLYKSPGSGSEIVHRTKGVPGIQSK